MLTRPSNLLVNTNDDGEDEDDDDDSDGDGVESEQGDVKDKDNGSVVPRPISAGQSQSAATPAGNADLKSRATFGTAPSTSMFHRHVFSHRFRRLPALSCFTD